jgi:alpha-tubulin suppressor-like RCC1 family protein
MEDGSIAAWGNGEYGKLGNNALQVVYPPYVLQKIPPVRSISTGSLQTGLLTVDGEYWAAGSRAHGALGGGAAKVTQNTFIKIDEGAASVAVGAGYVLVVKTDGTLWTSGAGSSGAMGTGDTSSVNKLALNKTMMGDNAAVFAGYEHALLLKNDGRLLAAGTNTYGQLGTGLKTAVQTSFKPVVDSENKPITDAAFVSAARDYTLILRKDGTLWAAGRNLDNKFGMATKDEANFSAVKVLERVVSVATGINHALAVTDDGTLWAAGSNVHKQFGNASTGKRNWEKLDTSALN